MSHTMSQDHGYYYQVYEDTYAEAGSYQDGMQEYEEYQGGSYQDKATTTTSRTKDFVDETQKEIGGRKHSRSSKNEHRRKANRKIEEFERRYKK